MSELIAYHLEDGIATLTLSNGKVNAISPAVVSAFNEALDQAEKDRAVVVITGTPGILSGGYDLKVMTAGPKEAIGLVTSGSTLARRLLSHPFPVIVACPGHAVAKGAFLLLSADYRIGVEGPFSIGLNEVAIGMTMHHAGIELARDRLRKSAFHRSVINAEMKKMSLSPSTGSPSERCLKVLRVLAPKRTSSGCQMRCMSRSVRTCLPRSRASDSRMPGRIRWASCSMACQVMAWA